MLHLLRDLTDFSLGDIKPLRLFVGVSESSLLLLGEDEKLVLDVLELGLERLPRGGHRFMGLVYVFHLHHEGLVVFVLAFDLLVEIGCSLLVVVLLLFKFLYPKD